VSERRSRAASAETSARDLDTATELDSSMGDPDALAVRHAIRQMMADIAVEAYQGTGRDVDVRSGVASDETVLAGGSDGELEDVAVAGSIVR
jgi:class 3 adenylate cyclase